MFCYLGNGREAPPRHRHRTFHHYAQDFSRICPIELWRAASSWLAFGCCGFNQPIPSLDSEFHSFLALRLSCNQQPQVGNEQSVLRYLESPQFLDPFKMLGPSLFV